MPPSAHTDTFARDHLPPAESWPELVFDLPEMAYPSRLNCAVELLDRMVAAGHGERIALRFPGGTWTYRALLRCANRIAHVLRDDLHLLPGQRVLLRGFNGPLVVACWLAVLKAGGINVVTMPLLRAGELRRILAAAEVDVALCDVRLREELDLACLAGCGEAQGEHPAARRFPARVLYFDAAGSGALEAMLAEKPDDFASVDTAAGDVALIAFTSGTTGQPKGAMHFHRDVMAMCDAFPRSMLDVRPDDVFCGTPPLAFTYGLGGLLCFPLRHGASVVLIERPTPEVLLRVIADCHATICFTVPAFWREMAAQAPGFDLSSLRACVSAGEALPDATRQAWKAASGIEIVDGIGTTEMLHIFISHTPETVRRGAIGRVIPGYRACIFDDNGNTLPAGVAGRLAVKGPTGCRYLCASAGDVRQQAAYVENGWNITGDICSMDADGYVHYLARSDDIIVSSGYKIAGPEIESVLLGHPAVQECAVTGVPDVRRGQIVKAFIVPRAGHAPSPALAMALQDFVKACLAPYKYPRDVEFVSALPRTDSGKLQRFRLRVPS